jgi:hypothetical protein
VESSAQQTSTHSCVTCHGLARQITPPDTPQQNGVAERGNRNILEMSRCMLLAAHLPEEFWSSAVLVSAYVRNRCSPRVQLNMTPFEAWTGQKPSLSNLRVFGCCAYVHVLAKNRSKLGAKAIRCVFIGYPAESKAYLLWNSQTGKLLSPAMSTLLRITRSSGNWC